MQLALSQALATRRSSVLPLLLVAFLLGAQSDSAPPDADQPSVALIRVEGAITPITTNYITRAIAAADESGSIALLIELDTPGGLLESTQNIVQALFASDVPKIGRAHV